MKALGIAATGMLAQQTNVDVIANNIANANTTGYKSGRAAFQDLIYQSVNSAGMPSLATEVKALWSDNYLYLAYKCPFTKLTVFKPQTITLTRTSRVTT